MSVVATTFGIGASATRPATARAASAATSATTCDGGRFSSYQANPPARTRPSTRKLASSQLIPPPPAARLPAPESRRRARRAPWRPLWRSTSHPRGSRPPGHPPRGLVQSHQPDRLLPALPSRQGDRKRQPLPFAAAQVPRIAIGRPPKPDSFKSTLALLTRQLLSEPLADQEIARALRQQRHLPWRRQLAMHRPHQSCCGSQQRALAR